MVRTYECKDCGRTYMQDDRRTRSCIYCGSRRADVVEDEKEEDEEG